MAKVSIIIPTHNRPNLLPRAIDSALNAGSDVEVIVVDDASVDETGSVCRSMAGIRYIRLDHNQGTAGARNVGILASTAQYIALLDDDDLRLPGSLDLEVDALNRNDAAGFVCGAMIMADQNGDPTSEIVGPKWASGDVFWHLLELDFPVLPLSVVIRKECFSKVGLLNTELKGIDDWDLFVRIAELYPVLVLPQPVGIYRKPTPSSGQLSSAQAQHLCRAARHLSCLLNLPRVRSLAPKDRDALRSRTLKRIADTLLWQARAATTEGSYKFAVNNVMSSLWIAPKRTLTHITYRNLRPMLFNQSKAGH
jgi:hypothetical protein